MRLAHAPLPVKSDRRDRPAAAPPSPPPPPAHPAVGTLSGPKTSNLAIGWMSVLKMPNAASPIDGGASPVHHAGHGESCTDMGVGVSQRIA